MGGEGAYERLRLWAEAGGHRLKAERIGAPPAEAWSITVDAGVMVMTGGGGTIDAAAEQAIGGLRSIGVAFLDQGPESARVVDRLRVVYEGSWSGTFGGILEEGRSVEGRGTQTFEVKDPTVVGVFTKSDGGSGRMTVQLLSGSTVVREESSTDTLVML